MELNSGKNMWRVAHNKQGIAKLFFFHILSDIDGFWNDSEIELKHFHWRIIWAIWFLVKVFPHCWYANKDFCWYHKGYW